MKNAAIILGAILLALTGGCGGSSSQVAAIPEGVIGVVPAAQARIDPQAQVAPQLAAELAAELERVLPLYPPRAASAPPSSSASAAALNYDEEAGAFQWRYYSAGDYDQNGEVGVSDLTPLGVHFGKSTGGGPFDPNTVESVVDGDTNGEIGVTDVTPVGQNFGTKCQGYRLYYSTDDADVPAIPAEPNGAGTQQVTEVPLSEGTGTPAERKQFSYVPDVTPPAGYYWVRPYEDEELGTPSNAVAILGSTGTNERPFAKLTAEPIAGLAPLSVQFTAAGSLDTDGYIVSYDYDHDGDGQFETINAGIDSSFTYYYAGIFNARLRVTDNEGAQGLATAPVSVNIAGNQTPQASLAAVPSSGEVSLQVEFDASGSTDPDGSIVRIDFDLDGDGDYDLNDVDSVISHTYESAGMYQAVVRVTDDVGAQDTQSSAVLVRGPGNQPPLAALEVTFLEGQDAPARVYFDASSTFDADGPDDIVEYKWDWEADGVFDGTTLGPYASRVLEEPGQHAVAVRVVDTAGNASVQAEVFTLHGWSFLDLYALLGAWRAEGMLVNDRPAVVARGPLDSQVTFAASLSATGAEADDWLHVSVVKLPYGHQFHIPSSCLIAGTPAFCIHDGPKSPFTPALYYGRSVTPEGSDEADWYFLAVDESENLASERPKLTEVDGRPTIVYVKGTSEDKAIYYNRSITVSGQATADWQPSPLVELGSNRIDSGMLNIVICGGKPVVAWLERDPDLEIISLRVLSSSTSDGADPADWFAPITIFTRPYFEDRISLAEVDGRPAILATNLDGDVRYYVSADQDGAQPEDWAEYVDFSGERIYENALGTAGGMPIIIGTRGEDGPLMFGRSTTQDGSDVADWTFSQIIDGMNSYVWSVFSLANGNPAVVFDPGDGTVSYAFYH